MGKQLNEGGDMCWCRPEVRTPNCGRVECIPRSGESTSFSDLKIKVMTFDFGHALCVLKSGGRVAREGWNGKDMWIKLQTPDANSKMRQSYIYMSPVGGDLVPWLASQSDMLANDWVLID